MVLLTILFVVIGGAVGGSEGAVTAFLLAAAMNFFHTGSVTKSS
jgi:hypothetical protein